MVRNKIKMFAQTKVTLPPGRHKMVILDEADRWVLPLYTKVDALEGCRGTLNTCLVASAHHTHTHVLPSCSRALSQAASRQAVLSRASCVRAA